MSEIINRFKSKIVIDKDTGCWNWTGYLMKKDGYGGFNLNGKTTRAHRAAYMLYKGEIPDNLYVLHKCDNTKCVNPEHLFLGTPKDNMQDCLDKGRKIRVACPSYTSYIQGCRCVGCSESARLYSKNRWLLKKSLSTYVSMLV